MALTRKQISSIPRILAAKTIEAGCRECNINKSTFYRWLKNPIFEAEVRRQRKRIVDRAYELLQEAHERAALKLIELLESEDERVAVRCAEGILDRHINFTAAEQLERRLDEIEEKIKNFMEGKIKDGAKCGECHAVSDHKLSA